MTASIHPLHTYIMSSLQYFSEESKRLKSKEPVEKFKLIVDAYIRIEEKLGQLDHDVALHTIKIEFKNVRRDIAERAKGALTQFLRYRSLASQQARDEQQRKVDSESYLREFREHIEQLKAIDTALAGDTKDIYDSVVKLEALHFSFSSTWRALSWTGLWIDFQQFGIYVWYLVARTRVFIQFHAFIFLVPILIMGIGYSMFSEFAIRALLSARPPSLWLGPALVVGVYFVKKYFFDKKLKALQKTVEARLLLPLSQRLLLARTLALQVKTHRQKPQ